MTCLKKFTIEFSWLLSPGSYSVVEKSCISFFGMYLAMTKLHMGTSKNSVFRGQNTLMQSVRVYAIGRFWYLYYAKDV